MLDRVPKKLVDDKQPTNLTANEFRDIVLEIRAKLDPEFRLVNNGPSCACKTKTCIKLMSSATTESVKKVLKDRLKLDLPTSVATGIEKRDGWDFRYLVVSKTNKRITTQKILEEELKKHPGALTGSVGDGGADYDMHRLTKLSWHVGDEEVFRKTPLPQCIMVRGLKGEDNQHIPGTLRVLALLIAGIGKSVFDLQYISHQDSSGTWTLSSPRELGVIPQSV